MIAHPRFHAAPFGAGIHGDPFTDHTIRPDMKGGGFALEFQILRRMADGSERIDAGARTHHRTTGHGDMADQFNLVFQDDIWANGAKRTDDHIRTQTGGGIDNG